MRRLQCTLRRADIPFGSVDEPVQTWQDKGLLGTMYSGALSMTSFQYMCLVSRVDQLVDALRGPEVPELLVCERGPWSDAATFAQMGVAPGPEAECASPPSLPLTAANLFRPLSFVPAGALLTRSTC